MRNLGLIENAIRPSAVGKKNFLFIGSPNAGKRSAIIYSIIVSCQRHGIDPLGYMADLLHRLPNMSNQEDLDHFFQPIGKKLDKIDRRISTAIKFDRCRLHYERSSLRRLRSNVTGPTTKTEL